jgi:predicted DsbA family dithiol-disulfide isomerase
MKIDGFNTGSMDALRIEVWSDIACPWCWIGKRGLDVAIEQFGQPVSLLWRAFELNPQAPLELPGKVDYVQRLADKYGVDQAAAQQMIDRIVARGKERGLELRFDRIRPTNTFDAHRLLAWAADPGTQTPGLQTELKEAIFRAYLNEGRLVSDHVVLVELAERVGLDQTMARQTLESSAFATEVRQDEQRAAQIGISGVPCFVFPQTRTGISGAQPPDVLLQAMQKAQPSLAGSSGLQS